MVDAQPRGRSDDGLSVIGDAHARCLDHRQIVRAIADRQRFGER
jgi:hypothetical protein